MRPTPKSSTRPKRAGTLHTGASPDCSEWNPKALRVPIDRAKSGTKRSLLTDGEGVLLGLAVSGANTHDNRRLVEETLQSVPVRRPKPTRRKRQNLCDDKGYDYPDVRQLLRDWGCTAHIKSRGEEESERKQIPGYRARRWAVERTHSWFNRFRRLLIRWEKKVENYAALLHFACAWVTFPTAGIVGWALSDSRP